MTGRSGRAYSRRLAEAGRDVGGLMSRYPELAVARSQCQGRADQREQERADRLEDRRRAAWEQVRRLNGQV